MIGITVALEKEVLPLLKILREAKPQTDCGKNFTTGTLFGKDVVIGVSNIGKVSAAMVTQIIIDKFSPSYIINFGTAGGIKEKVNPLSYYLIEKSCQYDFDLSKLDKCPIGYNQNYNSVFIENQTKDIDFLKKATLASADKFTYSIEDIELIKRMKCDIYDMEGGAISQVCLSNNIPLYIVKGITDVFGSGIKPEQFYENLVTVCNGFPNILSKLITEIEI